MNNLLYLIAVVAIGWAVTFGLRALPFLLFAGKDRELPAWVEKLGNIVSPVIIAGLIVYSYATLKIGEGEGAILAWKTAWPYLAGALTVGLQLWKRNPLMSIIAGTVLYMCVLNCGCASQRQLQLDPQDPSIRYTAHGFVLDGKSVEVKEIVEALTENEVPFNYVIHVGVDDDVSDLQPARKFIYQLGAVGWTSVVLVTRRHSESINLGKPKKKSASGVSGLQSAPAKPKKIRYKKATE